MEVFSSPPRFGYGSYFQRWGWLGKLSSPSISTSGSGGGGDGGGDDDAGYGAGVGASGLKSSPNGLILSNSSMP